MEFFTVRQSCCQRHLLFVITVVALLSVIEGGNYTLGMESEATCTKTHYYEADDIFKASADGVVHDGNCRLTFIQSGTWHSDSVEEPCYSLCIRITSYTMDTCEVKMAYHDGLNDIDPATFDCHTYPPSLWCSGGNDLKVSISEEKNYQNKYYAIRLEVRPFCRNHKDHTTDGSVIAQPKTKPSTMSQTAVIIGAVVGTISILFVLFWLIYCYRKRNSSDPNMSQERRADRNVRSVTPNQPVNRYCPVERNPASSQSSSDRGVGAPYKPDLDRNTSNPANLGERRLYSPFQPPQPTKRNLPEPQQPSRPPQQIYSDFDRGPVGGDKWYPMTTMGQVGPNMGPIGPALGQPQLTTKPQGQSGYGTGSQNQYMQQNQVYNYPQFNNQDGEMHTMPTDTRFVVYDFDYEKPLERKFSLGKSRNPPHSDSPIKDMERQQRPREITPLRETVRVMPPIDSTTDHTSDNDSSVSGTTEDDTTDDPMSPVRPYNYVPPYNFYNQGPQRPQDSNTRVYDPQNFQRIDNVRPTLSNQIDKPLIVGQGHLGQRVPERIGPNEPQIQDTSLSASPPKGVSHLNPTGDSNRQGPIPQVPPIPKDFEQGQRSSPGRELPWPHGPPPPYSPGERFVI